jgi:hypothetical protein
MDHGFYEAYKHSGGVNWKRSAGVPPMHYSTHSIGALVSATGAHATKVSCFGYRDDQHEDQVFGEGKKLCCANATSCATGKEGSDHLFSVTKCRTYR